MTSPPASRPVAPRPVAHRPVAHREGALARAVRDLVRVVLPVECPGCGHLDVRLCDVCAAAWTTAPRRCEAGAARLDRMDGRQVLPVWSLTAYTGPARHVVVAWKDRGRADLTRELGGALAAAAGTLAPALAPLLAPLIGPPRARPEAGGSAVVGRPAAGRAGVPVAVVPTPSAWSARRGRGREPVRELATAAARGLAAAGVAAQVVPALRRRGRSHDQVGLGARARAENLRGRFVVARAGRALRGRVVVLVDDVLTTGSTLAACEEALGRAGVVVVGALVLAATPPPRARTAPEATNSADLVLTGT